MYDDELGAKVAMQILKRLRQLPRDMQRLFLCIEEFVITIKGISYDGSDC